jgi:hypothetical protein
MLWIVSHATAEEESTLGPRKQEIFRTQYYLHQLKFIEIHYGSFYAPCQFHDMQSTEYSSYKLYFAFMALLHQPTDPMQLWCSEHHQAQL